MFDRYRLFMVNEYLSRAFRKAFAGLNCRDYFAG